MKMRLFFEKGGYLHKKQKLLKHVSIFYVYIYMYLHIRMKIKSKIMISLLQATKKNKAKTI